MRWMAITYELNGHLRCLRYYHLYHSTVSKQNKNRNLKKNGIFKVFNPLLTQLYKCFTKVPLPRLVSRVSSWSLFLPCVPPDPQPGNHLLLRGEDKGAIRRAGTATDSVSATFTPAFFTLLQFKSMSGPRIMRPWRSENMIRSYLIFCLPQYVIVSDKSLPLLTWLSGELLT